MIYLSIVIEGVTPGEFKFSRDSYSVCLSSRALLGGVFCAVTLRRRGICSLAFINDETRDTEFNKFVKMAFC